MRFSTAFVFLSIVLTGALAQPLGFRGSAALDTRALDTGSLDSRDLYEPFLEERDMADFDLDGVDAREYEDDLAFEARAPHNGVAINVQLKRDLAGNEFDERGYFEDADELEARYDEGIEERELDILGQGLDARDEYLDLETRDPMHPRFGLAAANWNN